MTSITVTPAADEPHIHPSETAWALMLFALFCARGFVFFLLCVAGLAAVLWAGELVTGHALIVPTMPL